MVGDGDYVDRLSETEFALLREVVARQDSDLLPVVDEAVGVRLLSANEVRHLSDALLAEFLESLDENSEPSAHGKAVDGVIGRLQRLGERWHRTDG